MSSDLDNMVGQIMSQMAFTSENTGNLVAFAITMILGFLVYFWAVALVVTEKSGPYPIWMHCWYVTVDVLGTICFWYLAANYDWFWMFVVFGCALPVWVILEVWSLWQGVKYEREENFQRYYKNPVTAGQAWLRVIVMILLFATLNGWVFYLLGGFDNAALFTFYPVTNFILSTGPESLWASRAAKGTRRGNSMGLQILILCQVTVTWMPAGIGWWASVSPLFDSPAYYLLGFVCSCISVVNLVRTAKLPPKEKTPGRLTVW